MNLDFDEFVPKRVIVRSSTDVGREDLACKQFQFKPRVFSNIKVSARGVL